MTRGLQEEGGWEYASDHQGTPQGKEEAHAESAVLVQPLVSEAQAGEGGPVESGTVPLCERGSIGNCSRDAGGIGHAHGKRLVKSLENDGSNQGSVCDGISTLIYLVPGIGEIRGAAGGFSPGSVLMATSARLKWFARVRDAGTSMICIGILINVRAVAYAGGVIVVVCLTISAERWYRARRGASDSKSNGVI
jgi:hypothetical protein